MASTTDIATPIPVSITGSEPLQQDNVIILSDQSDEMWHETDDQMDDAGLNSIPKPSVVENLSSFDLRLKRDDCDGPEDGIIDTSDNDSAKAGLDDSTDDDDDNEQALPPNGDIDSEISMARKRHMDRLAEIYSRMEQAARDHDNVIETVFRTKIGSLNKVIEEGVQEREKLSQTLQQRDVEIATLHKEMELEKERHKEELDQQHRLAEEEKVRVGKQWERELHEAMGKRGREHQDAMERQHQEHQDAMERQHQEHHQAMERQQQEHHQAVENQSREHQAAMEQRQQEHEKAMEQRQQEHEKAMAALREEMTKESEQRVSSLLEETGREAEQRVSKVRAEMDRMKAEFEREREQTMKEMKSEMARLVEREREARERSRRVEMAHNNRGYGLGQQGQGQGQDDLPQLPRPLHQSSSWAIARLWGVGQTRARSFS